MKSIIVAAALSIVSVGAANAAPAIAMDRTFVTTDQAVVTNVAWLSRYGKLCYHGPVWIPACHATNRPVGYMRGHWNAMGTRFIPGRYY